MRSKNPIMPMMLALTVSACGSPPQTKAGGARPVDRAGQSTISADALGRCHARPDQHRQRRAEQVKVAGQVADLILLTPGSQNPHHIPGVGDVRFPYYDGTVLFIPPKNGPSFTFQNSPLKTPILLFSASKNPSPTFNSDPVISGPHSFRISKRVNFTGDPVVYAQVRDTKLPSKEIVWYPFSMAGCAPATFERTPAHQPVAVDAMLLGTVKMYLAGYVTVNILGKSVRLMALKENPETQHTMIMVGDVDSNGESRSRYYFRMDEDDGSPILFDFNELMLIPCVFSSAPPACPVVPKENRVTFEIPYGEAGAMYRDHARITPTPSRAPRVSNQ